MKKLLIASAALAMVAGTAQAQSSVTVYGLYDLGYSSVDMKNVAGATGASGQNKFSGVNGGASTISGNGALASNRIGFRGVEDIGGGVRAGFNLELGFAGNASGNDAGNTVGAASAGSAAAVSTTPRESKVFVGSNSLGTIEVGYGTTGLHSTVIGHRAISGSNFYGDVAYASDDSASTKSSADSRIHLNAVRMNGVTYKSPTVNGFDARIDLGNERNRKNSAGNDDDKAQNTGLTVNYSAGALKLSATTHEYVTRTAANAGTDYKFNAVSAQYRISPAVVVDALYANNKETNNQSGAQVSKNDVMQAGIKYTIGKTDLAAQYGKGEGEGANGTTAQRDRKGYQLAAIYNLSKRTNVYALYGNQEMTYVTDGSITAGTKEKVSGYAVGLRHSF